MKLVVCGTVAAAVAVAVAIRWINDTDETWESFFDDWVGGF